MKIYEYQAKRILRNYNVFVPNGYVVSSFDEAKKAFLSLEKKPCVIKAQILAGGRGKSGGVKIAHTEDEVKRSAKEIIGSTIITSQTGETGIEVKKVLIEEIVPIDKEFYMAFVMDRVSESPLLIVSTEGGVEIEEVAAKSPKKIHKERIDPLFGIHGFQSRRIAKALQLRGTLVKDITNLLNDLLRVFKEKDCSLLEINPLALTTDNKLCALDIKIDVDDNALYRQHDISILKEFDDPDSLEAKAFEYELSYINLDGNIGCMVNGAGLAMATMDIIKLHGGEPANFLDVGGDAPVEKVKLAFELVLADKKVKGILVNIFGGIMKCDVIAKGIVQAVHEGYITVPLVVRLEGTNVNIAKDILENSGLNIISADSMKDAAEKIVRLVK